MKVLVDPVTLIRRRQQGKRKKQRRNQEDMLTTLVMASHVRGLECWHALIRTGALPFEIDCILHVDSHPDMMLPKGNFADAEDDPRAVYERLEASQGGIAEWLLPAFYLGQCKRLVWLRAKWCDQLKDGESEFFIGLHKNDGSLKVTSLEPYFVDEPGTYAPLEELKRVRPVRMLVASLEEKSSWSEIKRFITAGEQSASWLLDVCLDYFAVSNPFYDHAIRLFGITQATKLRKAFLSVRWRRVYEKRRCELGGGVRSDVEILEKTEFERCTKKLFSTTYPTLGEEEQKTNDLALESLFDDPEAYEDLRAVANDIRQQGNPGMLVALELLESPGLPHHPELDIKQQIQFREFLSEEFLQSPPHACIVAKSDEDEYTPGLICQELDKWIIDTMESTWSSSKTVEAISVEVLEDE